MLWYGPLPPPHTLLLLATAFALAWTRIPAKGVGEFEEALLPVGGWFPGTSRAPGKQSASEMDNYCLAEGRSTGGQTLLLRCSFGREAKSDWVKREAKCGAVRQTLVPVTGMTLHAESAWARQGSNLQGLLQRILSPSRLPIPPRAQRLL